MNVIVVDDERIIMTIEAATVKNVLPQATVTPFQKAKDALAFAETNTVDIALLDINMEVVTGLQLAQKLQAFHPQINIIFCTGYSEYSLDAHDLYCSAYLMKPITEEKLVKALNNLRYPVSDKIPNFKVQCFGNFEVFKDGVPLKFKREKSKELFAYLIDRRGAAVSTSDIMVVLFEDDDKEAYVRSLKADLNNMFEELGLAEVFTRSGSKMGINVAKVDCDYYDYLAGKKELFYGEYMSQYSFAEATLAALLAND